MGFRGRLIDLARLLFVFSIINFIDNEAPSMETQANYIELYWNKIHCAVISAE